MTELTVFLASLAIGYLVSIIIRMYKQGNTSSKTSKDTIRTLVFFGSGGHTTEMIKLLQNMNIEKYTPAHFVICPTDVTSVQKVEASELKMLSHATWHTVYRSREVKQSWISTLFSTLKSLIDSIKLVYLIKPELIICNGPGTCVPICYAAWLFRLIRLQPCKIIFVESFCRVQNLSLSGKLMYYIADKFIVQWQGLVSKYPKSQYVGVIC